MDYTSELKLTSYSFLSFVGMYILQLLDNYVATWSIVIICIMECVVITFVYGPDRLLNDIKVMTGTRYEM